jgi:hypothetical protein
MTITLADWADQSGNGEGGILNVSSKWRLIIEMVISRREPIWPCIIIGPLNLRVPPVLAAWISESATLSHVKLLPLGLHPLSPVFLTYYLNLKGFIFFCAWLLINVNNVNFTFSKYPANNKKNGDCREVNSGRKGDNQRWLGSLWTTEKRSSLLPLCSHILFLIPKQDYSWSPDVHIFP